MSYVQVNPAWRPAPRRLSLGPVQHLRVEWESEQDQEFQLSPEDRQAVIRGRLVLVKR